MCSAVSAFPIGCAIVNSGFNNDATLSDSCNTLFVNRDTLCLAFDS
jgi:hypothetical protein